MTRRKVWITRDITNGKYRHWVAETIVIANVGKVKVVRTKIDIAWYQRHTHIERNSPSLQSNAGNNRFAAKKWLAKKEQTVHNRCDEREQCCSTTFELVSSHSDTADKDAKCKAEHAKDSCKSGYLFNFFGNMFNNFGYSGKIYPNNHFYAKYVLTRSFLFRPEVLIALLPS
jgi:hypothetical protein